jgi:hypothetical protein
MAVVGRIGDGAEMRADDKRRYPSREGKRAATVYVDVADYRKLRVLAAMEDKSLQDIMLEALAEFLSRRQAST